MVKKIASSNHSQNDAIRKEKKYPQRRGWILGGMVCALFTTSCAINPKTGQYSLKETFASDDPCSNNARNIGIAVGVVAGTVLGNQVQHSNSSRILGAAMGGAIGGLIGHDIDQRRCALYKIAQRNNLEMRFEDIKSDGSSGGASELIGSKVLLKDNDKQFNRGTDELNTKAKAYFQEIADQYSYETQRKKLPTNASQAEQDRVNELRNKRILLVGHTDDTGSSRLNADLSERRALAVARIFRSRGISEDRIFYQGAGETLPMADNRTEEGRARNRRVEISDLTDEKAFQAYLESRKPNLTYYRTSEQPSTETAPQAGSTSSSRASHRITRRKTDKPATEQSQNDSTAQRETSATASRSSSKSNARTSAVVTAQSTTRPSVNAPASRTSEKPIETTTSTTGSTKIAIGQATGAAIRLDFGGQPVNTQKVSLDIGKVSSSGGFGLISSAHADDLLTNTCTKDRPRVGHGVKSLRDNKEIKTQEYMRGLYGTSWVSHVNGHLVALNHVAVLRDGGVPARQPDLYLYQDFKGNREAKAVFQSSPQVNSYQGDKAVLYRVFVNGPIKCMDLIIPNQNPTEATGSHLFYQQGSTLYMTDFKAVLAK